MTDKQRRWMGVIAKALMIGGLLLGGYYFWGVRPRAALPSALAAAEAQLVRQQTNLLQNRVALVELARLDPASGNALAAKQDLFSRLQATHQAGQILLKEQSSLPTIAGFPGQTLSFVNTELLAAISSLTTRHRRVLLDQQPIIETVVGFDRAVARLLEYNAAADLGELSLPSQRQEAGGRARAGSHGLTTIEQALASYQHQPAVPGLRREISQQQERLEALAAEVEFGNIAAAELIRQQIIREFPALQRQALAAELAVIRTRQSVALLTEQTNLLLEYDFWLDRVGSHQAAQ